MRARRGTLTTVVDAADDTPTQIERKRQPPPPRRPPAPSGTASPEDPRPTVWERLIVSGKERGYVTVAEIDAVFRSLDARPPGDLEPAFKLLRSMGVEVLHS